MKTPRRLEPLLEEGIIEEVHSQLMSGKEAACYVVSAGGETRVAKVYKEAQQRAFQNRATYMEARNIRNSRDRRAIKKGTNYGKKQLEQAWQSAEVDALFRMHGAGVRVPTPYVFSEGVLIMELVHDGTEAAAPRLSEMNFSRAEALETHAELMRQCALMLLGGLVHADLSEFNVLMAPSGPTIIDFPQAVDAAANNSARRIFIRDTDNLTRYLARFASELKNRRFGAHLWRLYERGELTPEMDFDVKQVAAAAPRPQAKSSSQDDVASRSKRRAVVEIAPERARGGGGSPRGGRGGGGDSRRGGRGGGGDSRRGSRGGRDGSGPNGASRDGAAGDGARTDGPRPEASANPAAEGSGGGRKRRRRRRGGGGGGGTNPNAATDARPTEAKRSRPDRGSSGPTPQRDSTPRPPRAEAGPARGDAAAPEGAADGAAPRKRRRRRRRRGGGSAPAGGAS